jgi:hypothetical protein
LYRRICAAFDSAGLFLFLAFASLTSYARHGLPLAWYVTQDLGFYAGDREAMGKALKAAGLGFYPDNGRIQVHTGADGVRIPTVVGSKVAASLTGADAAHAPTIAKRSNNSGRGA